MFRYFASILSDEKNFLTVSAVFLALGANLSVLLDVPVLRQLFGFAFLTILPGILLLRFFKMREGGFLEEIILCWGLSVAFVMFYTLALNGILPALGYTAPLSSSTLLFCLDLALVPLGIMFYRAGGPPALQFPRVEVTKSNASLYIVPLFFPLLSVIGSFVMRVYNSNSVSLALLVFMALYVAFVCLKNNCPKSLYPVLIFSVGLSVLLLWSLRSNHLLGADLHAEYYYFQSILSDHRMIIGSAQQPAYPLYAGLASILLPVAYQLILGVNQEVLFNVIYGLLFSVVPLIVYVISRRYVEERYALIASFLYISQVGFMDANALSRAVIAILFFALAFMVLFSAQKRGVGEVALITVFAAAGIVSHYTTAYLFIFVFAAALILIILSRKASFTTAILAAMMLLLGSVTYVWYSLVTASSSIPFGISILLTAFSRLIPDLFEPQTRGGAQTYLGAGASQTTVAATIGVAVTWVVVACLLIGVATLVVSTSMTTFYSGSAKLKFLKARFGVEHFALALAGTGVLIASVVLPYVAIAYPLERTFLFVTTFLSVFFVIGVIVLSNGIAAFSETIHRRFREKTTSKLKASDSRQGNRTIQANLAVPFALIIVVAYLLCTSGALASIAGTPRSVTLDSQGAIYFERYVYDQDAVAAKWLKLYGGTSPTVSTTDEWGTFRLISQGHITPGLIDGYSFQTNKSSTKYTYLYYYNVVEKKYEVSGDTPDIPGNMAVHLKVLSNQSRVLDNGGSQIYARYHV